MITTADYYFRVFPESYLFREVPGRVTSRKGANIGAIVQVIQVKAIPGIIHYELVSPSTDSNITTAANQPATRVSVTTAYHSHYCADVLGG